MKLFVRNENLYPRAFRVAHEPDRLLERGKRSSIWGNQYSSFMVPSGRRAYHTLSEDYSAEESR